eukprot:3612826-Rhodomonas_salina.1
MSPSRARTCRSRFQTQCPSRLQASLRRGKRSLRYTPATRLLVITRNTVTPDSHSRLSRVRGPEQQG